MIALDTNVLVRLIVRDDDAQAAAAERLLIAARRQHTPLFVGDVVLCELEWVLRARYKLSRADIADAIDSLVSTESIVVSDSRAVEASLVSFRSGRGSLADYLVREQALSRGSSEVVTFDRVLKGEKGFKVIGRWVVTLA